MNKLRLKASAFAMSYLSNEEKVRNTVRGLDIHMRRQPRLTDEGIKVSAVRFTPQSYKNLHDYVTKMNEYVAPAAAEGSAIVAFPELCGMAAMSLMPGYHAINSDWQKLKNASAEERQDGMMTICESVQGFVSEIFLNTFSQLARSHRIIIAAGGIYQTENGRLYNRQFLFNEEGEVSAVQDKLFLTAYERDLGITAGKRLCPASTRLGGIAMVGGSSLCHYEPFWIASALGCNFAVASASPYTETEHWLARYRAQEQGICVLLPGYGGGDGFGTVLSSTAGIYQPRGSRCESKAAVESDEANVVTASADPIGAKNAVDVYNDDENIRFMQSLISPQE